MNLNDMKIGKRLIALISSVIAAVVIIMIVILRQNIVNLQEENARIIGEQLAGHWINVVKSSLEVPLDEVRSMANLIEDSLISGKVNLTRDGVNEILRGHLKRRKNIVGVYVGFEPNRFDGQDAKYAGTAGHDKTGRFIPYWTHAEGGKINLDPLMDYDKDGAGDYYQVPKKTKKEAIIEPYEYEVGGKKILMTSLVVPVLDRNGNFIGIVGADIEIGSLHEIYSKVKIFNSGYINLFSGAGMIVGTGSGLDIIGKNLDEIVPSREYIDGVKGGAENFTAVYTSSKTGTTYVAYGANLKIGNTDSDWATSVNIPYSEIMAAANRVVLYLVIIGLFAIGIVTAVVYFISRMISDGLNKGVSFAEKISKGDFTERVNLVQQDEVGHLANSLNTAADNLEKLIGKIIINTGALSSSVEEINSGNQNLSQRTAEQASSLEEIASTIEESTATTNRNYENALEADKLAKEAANLASDGGTLVNSAVVSINEIQESSKKMAEIINVINEIAFQTNLLALNAAVEAARAGEQGRGFAVVAGEVRNLAQRSGNAARDIGDLIKASVEKINSGTEQANKSGEALRQIVEAVNRVNYMISEIATASEEQKSGMDQINKAILQLDDMTQQNAALVEETASSSEEVTDRARELLTMVKAFKINEYSDKE